MENKNKKIIYIAEFAKMAGVHPLTVRNYQRRGLLPDRRNPFNQYRIFTEEDLQKFKQIISSE
jgi:DNA-binding transcriptional MerR regulator